MDRQTEAREAFEKICGTKNALGIRNEGALVQVNLMRLLSTERALQVKAKSNYPISYCVGRNSSRVGSMSSTVLAEMACIK